MGYLHRFLPSESSSVYNLNFAELVQGLCWLEDDDDDDEIKGNNCSNIEEFT